MNQRDWKVAGIAVGVVAVIAAIVAVIISVAGGSDEKVSNQGSVSQVTSSMVVPTTTVAPSTTSKRPTTTSRSTSTTTTAPPTLGAGVPDTGGATDIFGLKLKLGDTWEALEDPTFPARVVVVNKTQPCTSTYRPHCPGFAVVDLKQSSGEALLPYSLSNNVGNGNDCFYDGLHDNMYYHDPVKIGTTTIGGVLINHFVQPQCGGPDELHSWPIESKKVVVVDTWVDPSQKTVVVPGLSGPNELFSTAR